MTLAIRRVRLRAVTGEDTFGADVELHRGLTVINAPNTSGKSTITQAILYGLGLEATLGPQRDVPLPHAMTHTLNDDGVERPVLESQVILEVETGDGSAFTVRRYVKHPNIDQRLISVWRGSLPEVETGEAPERMDFFVRDPGAAQREAGFHRFLADELGWSLPEVPKFSGGAALLYIEAVVPLFFVEQKRGWGGIQAVVPTQFQIRDVRRRSLEFLLGLDVQERATRIDTLRTRLRDLTADWAERCGALKALTTTIAASIDGLPSRPTAEWPLEVPPTVRVATSTSWESLDAAIVENRQALSATLRREVPNVGDEAPSAERQLAEMENELRRLGALASENVTQEELEEATSRDARCRLAAIDEDIRRHADLEKLRDFGSTLEVRLHRDNCPTCHQTFPDVLLETEDAPRALGISGSLTLLRQRRALLVALVSDADRVVEARRSRTRALRSTARDLRASIRAIKDTLVSPSSQPSIASVQRRLQLEARVTSLTSVRDAWLTELDAFAGLSRAWRETVAELRGLEEEDLSVEDRLKLQDLELTFRGLLGEFGFTSCPIEQVILSADDYMPTHEGFELSFDLSASDGVRLIWAYLLSLLEVSKRHRTNHPQMLILDEPGQQAMAGLSLGALLERSAAISAEAGQVIVATSESSASLAAMLGGAGAHVVRFDQKILQRLPT